jgi:4-amino-4-deoxy-L-arabinose transferase-like glycosyltransferase
MGSPNAPILPSDPARRRLLEAAAVLALALYAFLLIWNVGAVAGGSDSSGYMNHARVLASGHLQAQPRTIEGLPRSAAPPLLYIPLGFKPAWNGDGMVPTYPMGFSLFVLLAKPVIGWRHAGDLTIILHSLAGLVATFALGRMLGLECIWAITAAAIVGASPIYLAMSLQAMSDVPSLFWTTAAVLAALKSRERMPWAFAAGVAVALDVLLRPTNALALFPVGISLGASPRRWILLILGGLPGAVLFEWHSVAAYGSLMTTGYYGDKYAFSASYAPRAFLQYGRWIPTILTPIVVLALGVPWLRGETARIRWLLIAWIAAYLAFYSAYKFPNETWWYLRFLLPAVPAIAVAAMLVCRELLHRVPAMRRPARMLGACACAVAFVAVSSFWWCRELYALDFGREELRYGLASEWMEKNLPPNAVCMAMEMTGALYYDTNFTFLRWDQMNSGNVATVEAAVSDSKRTLYAVLFPFEIGNWGVLAKAMPGHWRLVGRVDDLTVWRHEI